ncbi:hypothetical protein B0H19DRAFT_131340 [Mycena capillaripes]|nr:hypothetical protein B0H19DRAFT_131340 [Mycena capillaripes]
MYHWRDFLGVLLHRWSPSDGFQRRPQTYSGTKKISVVAFLSVMTDLRFVAAMTSSAQQPYFLSSKENWTFEFARWVGPTIRSLECVDLPAVEDWDITQLYRELCQLSLDDSEIESSSPNWELLRKVLLEARAERSYLKRINRHAFHPKPSGSSRLNSKAAVSAAQTNKAAILGPQPKHPRNIRQHVLSYDDAETLAEENKCPKCRDKPAVEHCIRRIPVQHRPASDIEQWNGAILTCAEPGDVMLSEIKHQHVLSPEELGFSEIQSRPETFARCDRDMTLLIEDGTSKLVAGIQFNAWDQATLEDICTNHTLAGKYAKNAKRSAKMQMGGILKPLGSRMPKGGRPGDGYGAYAYQTAANIQGVEALFAAARDTDTLMETVRAWAPQVVRDIRNCTADAGINRMGRTGMNSFYCWEYASTLHRDADSGWSIVCQLYKKSRPDEYNFAFAEWGVFIRTEVNCVWFFNPKELHGTILPRQSSVASAISRGIHTTVRRKDMEQAALFQTVRETYDDRSAFWREFV